MATGKIGVSTQNLFPIIKKFLYSDHEIFLREIVSNAVDATQKLKVLASSGEFKGEASNLRVRVKADKEAGTLTVSDSGKRWKNTSTRLLFREQKNFWKNIKMMPLRSSVISDWDFTLPLW